MKKNNYFFFISIILTGSYFLPLIFENLFYPFNSHFIYSLLWFLSLIIFYPRLFLAKIFIPFYIYLIFLFISLSTYLSSIDDWNKRFLFTESYHIFVGLSIYTYYVFLRNDVLLNLYVKFSLIFIFITAFMSIISFTIDPLYARNLTGIESFEGLNVYTEINEMRKYGGGSYGTSIAFMTTIPLYFLFHKNNNFNKIYILFLIIITYIALLSMQIFTNIVIATLTIFLLLSRNIARRIILVLSLLLVLLILPKNIYVSTLYYFGSKVEKFEELNFKINELAKTIELGLDTEKPETGISGRAQRYPELINVFIKEPFWGCFYQNNDGNGYNGLGAHIYWMNKLTVTGILGFTFFMFFLFKFISDVKRRVEANGKLILFISFFVFIFYGVFKNISSKGAWFSFLVFVPLFILFSQNNTKNG